MCLRLRVGTEAMTHDESKVLMLILVGLGHDLVGFAPPTTGYGQGRGGTCSLVANQATMVVHVPSASVPLCAPF